MSDADRQRLAAILGMLGSEHAGERAAAGLQAEAFRRKHGLTWAELLAMPPPVEVAPEPPRWTPPAPPEPPPWTPALPAISPFWSIFARFMLATVACVGILGAASLLATPSANTIAAAPAPVSAPSGLRSAAQLCAQAAADAPGALATA